MSRTPATTWMTDAQASAVEAYLVNVMAGLRQGPWTVILMTGLSTGDAGRDESNATMRVVSGRWLAQLFLARDFFTRSPRAQRETLVHEALHLLVRPMQVAALEAGLEDALGTSAWQLFEAAFMRALEETVDHLAKLMAPTFALPRFPRDRAPEPPEADEQ